MAKNPRHGGGKASRWMSQIELDQEPHCPTCAKKLAHGAWEQTQGFVHCPECAPLLGTGKYQAFLTEAFHKLAGNWRIKYRLVWWTPTQPENRTRTAAEVLMNVRTMRPMLDDGSPDYPSHGQ